MRTNTTILKSLLPLSFLAILASCSSTKVATVDTDFVAKHGFIMAKPIAVDIKVEKRKIEGKATIKNSLYGKEAAVSAAKNLAVIDAVKRGDADILVQPVFEIEGTSGYTNASVSGYAGKYKEFRDLTPADTTAFYLRANMDASLVATTAAPGDLSVSKKKKGGMIAAIVVGAVLLISIIGGVAAGG